MFISGRLENYVIELIKGCEADLCKSGFVMLMGSTSYEIRQRKSRDWSSFSHLVTHLGLVS